MPRSARNSLRCKVRVMRASSSTTIQDQALTPREAAALLQRSERELLAAARRGDIPGVCLGGFWRFSRAKLLLEAPMK